MEAVQASRRPRWTGMPTPAAPPAPGQPPQLPNRSRYDPLRPLPTTHYPLPDPRRSSSTRTAAAAAKPIQVRPTAGTTHYPLPTTHYPTPAAPPVPGQPPQLPNRSRYDPLRALPTTHYPLPDPRRSSSTRTAAAAAKPIQVRPTAATTHYPLPTTRHPPLPQPPDSRRNCQTMPVTALYQPASGYHQLPDHSR